MRLVIICCLVVFLSMPVHAQNRTAVMFGSAQVNNTYKLMDDRYEKTLEVVKDEPGNKTNLYALYMLYPKTSHYNPFSRSVIKEMEMYAFKVDTSQDLIEMNRSLLKYNELLDQHLANFGVVEFALKMTRVNRRLGSEVFLRKIRDVLIDIVERPTLDGSAPDRAFKVISYSEEDYFLSKNNVTVKSSEVYVVGDKYYNVHDCEDENGEYVQFYVDVTTPIRQVDKLRELEKKTPDVRGLPPAQ